MSEESPLHPPPKRLQSPSGAAGMLSTPTEAAAAPGSAAGADWAEGFSPELREMVALKKYADPESLAQAYFHASKKLGKSPDSLLELPS